MKIKFSKTEFFFAGFFFVLLGVFSFLYHVKKEELRKEKEELAFMQEKVGEAQLVALSPEQITKITRAMERELEDLKKGLLASEEEVLARLYKLAGQQGVKIGSINSPGHAVDMAGEQWRVLDKPVKSLRLDISLTGGYIAVGKFLGEVRRDFKNLVVLDRLHMSKGGSPGEITVIVGAVVYLIPN